MPVITDERMVLPSERRRMIEDEFRKLHGHPDCPRCNPRPRTWVTWVSADGKLVDSSLHGVGNSILVREVMR